VASVTYNFVRPPSYDSDRQSDAVTLLLRYYMGGWEAVNVALHAEYTYRTIGKTKPLKENQFALVVDFDF
jgi:hypothetical protein